MALLFGVFQSIMPLVGYTIGKFAFQWIKSLDHWIAFFILMAIGIKMIIESFEKEDIKNEINYFQFKYLFSLSIATSLDAFGIGFTLSLLGYGIIMPVLLFGFTTFLVTLLGFIFGRKLKHFFGRKIEIFGGIILILIGIKILLEHMEVL
ncbi:MAG: manganese efflux pump MntP family protein [Thermoanaerobaculia bacterium]